MVGVVKKKKKPFLSIVIEKVKGTPHPTEQKDISLDSPLYDTRIDDDAANAIALRRDELRAAKRGNTDAVVTISGK